MSSSSGQGYYARAAALLKRDKGWIKPLLVMGIAQFVPVVGALGTMGYGLEWARLTAWGVDSSPKQKDVKVGQCIKSGWRGFVSVLGWSAALALIGWALDYLTQGNGTANGIMNAVVTLATLFLAPILVACAIRATVYQSFKAGYQANRIKDMVQRDFKGLARIAGMLLVITLVLMAATVVLLLLIVVPTLVSAVGTFVGGYMGERYAIAQVMSALVGTTPWLVVLFFAFCVGAAYVNLITYTAVALWMRQFDVPHWGASADPLPGAAPQYAQPQPVAPAAQQWQPPYQQAPTQQAPVQGVPYQQPMDQQQVAPAGQQAPAQQGWVAPVPQPTYPQPAAQPAPTPTPYQQPLQDGPASQPQHEPAVAPAPVTPGQPQDPVPSAPAQAASGQQQWVPVVPVTPAPAQQPQPVAPAPAPEPQPADVPSASEAPQENPPAQQAPASVEPPAPAPSGVSPLGELKPVEVPPADVLPPVDLASDDTTGHQEQGQAEK